MPSAGLGIIIATFTILNLSIGIIVSTIQELSVLPDPNHPQSELVELLERMKADLKTLRSTMERLRGPDGGS